MPQPHGSTATSSRARAWLPDRDQISLDSALLVAETSARQFAPCCASLPPQATCTSMQPRCHRAALDACTTRRAQAGVRCACRQGPPAFLRPWRFHGTTSMMRCLSMLSRNRSGHITNSSHVNVSAFDCPQPYLIHVETHRQGRLQTSRQQVRTLRAAAANATSLK